MIVVTGGAGFIGSCIAAALNQRGRDDLIVVDRLAPDGDPKLRNLDHKNRAAYYDKIDFLEKIIADDLDEPVECIIHMGACSSTTGTDAQYYDENNFLYTRRLAEWCLKHDVRFIYASSAATYGDGSQGYDDDESRLDALQPLNLYGKSKHKFDLWARDQGVLDRIVGLKFFNVFGPNEYHKGDMRSVVNKAYPRVAKEGRIGLFKSYHPDFADGEQKRDFVYVKDAVDMVMYFYDHPDIGGIYNIGTGRARSWNDLARALFKAVDRQPQIEYIDMPEHLRPRYQYFTQAAMDKIRSAGYTAPLTSLDDAVADYVGYLKNHSYF
ncbi:MAG: ADP-glyceromanno-heptose 6-epimerase [Candidatus Omnitrophota bacterium]